MVEWKQATRERGRRMIEMAKKRTTPKYPSRENVKYVPVSKIDWEGMKVLADAEDRSVAYMVKRAIRQFLEQNAKK